MKLDHINIQVDEIQKATEFYVKALGLKVGFRPKFDFDGAWLYFNNHAVIHLMPLSSNKSQNDFLGHIAFVGENYGSFIQNLDEQNINYKEFVVTDSNEVQIFIKDPNQITIEIQFKNIGEKK